MDPTPDHKITYVLLLMRLSWAGPLAFARPARLQVVNPKTRRCSYPRLKPRVDPWKDQHPKPVDTIGKPLRGALHRAWVLAP